MRMKILVLGRKDIADILGDSVLYGENRIRQFDMYPGNFSEALQEYAKFRPDLVIIDGRYGPLNSRVAAIQELEHELGIKQVTMQYVFDDNFKKFIQKRPVRETEGVVNV